MDLYLFGTDEVLESMIQEKDIISANHSEKLTGENFLNLEVPSWIDATEGKFIGFHDRDDNFQMFEIKIVDEDDENGKQIKSCYCEHVFYELRDNIVEDKRAYQTTALLALDDALSPTDCRWQIGDCDVLDQKSANFYYQSSLESLQDIRERWAYIDSYGKTTMPRLSYRLALTGGAVTARYVDLKKMSEEWTGKRFAAGKDINSINRNVDMSNLITACYGRGKGEEIVNEENDGSPQEGSTTYGRRITFEDVIWGGSNQLDNGDFETGDLTGWTGSAPIVTSPTPFSGEYCAKIYDSGTSTAYTITSDAILGYPYDTEYNCSAWIYTPAGVGRVSGYLVVDWYDPTPVANHSIKFEASAGRWTKITLLQQDGTRFKSYTSGTISAKVTLTVETGGTKDLYFDDVKFGDTVSKPYGQKFIEDPDAKAIWGRAGGTKNRTGVFQDDQETNPNTLLDKTWQYLQDNNEPRVSYEIKVADLESVYPHEATRLGDIVYILDDNFSTQIEVQARVIEMKRNLLVDEDSDIKVGNFIQDSTDTNKRQGDIERKLSDREAVWDRGTAFESTLNGTRMRMVQAEEGEYQSYIKYEDDSTPPNLVGYFSPNEFSYKKIRADEYVGQNIINVARYPLEIYVDSYAGDDAGDGTAISPYRTLNRLLSEGTIPKLLLDDVTIYILDTNPSGTTPYNEHVEFIGFIGSGSITLNIHSSVIINGSIGFTSCSVYIDIEGDYDAHPTNWSYINCTSTILSPIRITGCNRVRIKWLWINANDRTAIGIYVLASKVTLIECVAEHVSSTAYSAAIAAAHLGDIYVEECKGDNPNGYSLSTADGGRIAVKTSRPNAGLGAGNTVPYCLTDSGSIIAPSSMTGLPPVGGAASPSASTPVSAQTIHECNISDSGSYNYQYSRYRTNTAIYQGKWDAGNHAGIMLFNNVGETFADVKAAASWIRSAKLTMRRKSSGGYSSARNLHLWGLAATSMSSAPDFSTAVDIGEIASMRWGEVLTFSLPQAFLYGVYTGTINSLAIYDSSGEPFMLFDGYDEFETKVVFLYN